VANTQHLVPGRVVNHSGDTTLCYNDTGYGCAGAGYLGTSSQFNSLGWTPTQYWSYGSSDPSGGKHNCTSYAAYRLEQNGYAFPGWTGNGGEWARQADSHGTLVNQTPAVGAIAQWNYTKDGGDVAYVEVVTSAYIEITGDGLNEGTGRQRITYGSAYWPDNFIHFHDMTPTAAGTDHTVTGDFNGDTFGDVAAFYADAGSRTTVWTFNGASTGLGKPVLRWDSGVGNWNWSSTKVVAGDINGDGKSDVIAFYKYPNYETKMWVFYGSATGLKAPVLKWDSGAGKWNWDNVSAVATDVNGDHRGDVVVFYRYANAQTKAFVFYGTTSGVSVPELKWDSGVGKWDWNNAEFVSGDVNGDGLGDIVALYQYPYSQTKAFVFFGTSTGVRAPLLSWDSGVNRWNWNNIKLVAGDVNGDGKADAVAFYNYPNYETKSFLFAGTSTGLKAPVLTWDSGAGKWNWDNVKFVAVDVNHDRRTDALGFYRYAGFQTKAWLLYGQVSTFSYPQLKWDSGIGKWNWANM